MNLNWLYHAIPLTSLSQIKTLGKGTLFHSAHGEVFYGDFAQYLSLIEDESIDMAFTDCPYWTLDKHQAVGTTTRLKSKKYESIDATQLWHLICEFGRVLKKNTISWMMCDGQTLAYLLGYLEHRETPFTYYKPFPVLKRAKTGGVRSGTDYHGRCCHEFVVFMQKGRKNTLRETTNWVDVFDTGFFDPLWDGDNWSRRFTKDGKPYPTAKPVPFIERLIELSSDPGQTILDPFAGSGPCAAAAVKQGRYFKTCDNDEDAIYTTINAVDSLFQTTPQLEMFA